MSLYKNDIIEPCVATMLQNMFLQHWAFPSLFWTWNHPKPGPDSAKNTRQKEVEMGGGFDFSFHV